MIDRSKRGDLPYNICRGTSHLKIFVLSLFLCAVSTGLIGTHCAFAQTFAPGRYIDESRDHDYGRTFVKPHVRPQESTVRVVSELTEVNLFVGETILIPLFAQARDGSPLPILWTLENDIATAVGATIDGARPSSYNGYTYSSFGPRIALPSNIAGPNASSPVPEGLGCERRFYLKRHHSFFDGHFNSRRGQNRRYPTAFLCLHGRQEGSGQISVGEAQISFEFSQKPSQLDALAIEPAFLSPTGRTTLNVKVSEGPSQAIRSEMAMAEIWASECNVARCRLTVIPMNRGGEKLDCDSDTVEVDWIYNEGHYGNKSQQGCDIELEVKNLPPSNSPWYGKDFEVTAIVRQSREYPYESRVPRYEVNVKLIKQTVSKIYLHPTNDEVSETVKWASAQCPATVTQGRVFACLVSVVDDTGNPPGPYTIIADGWTLPGQNLITFSGFSTDNPNYVCFRVNDSVEDQVVDPIRGTLDNGVRFSSGRIAISEQFGGYIWGDKPRKCPVP